MRTMIEPDLGKLPLRRVTTQRIDAYYDSLARNRGLSPASIRHVHAVLRGSLGQAVRWGWISLERRPPARRRPSFAGGRSRRHRYPPHATLLEAADTHDVGLRRRLPRLGRNRSAARRGVWIAMDRRPGAAGSTVDHPPLSGLGRRRHRRQGDQDPRCSSHRRRRRDLAAGTAQGACAEAGGGVPGWPVRSSRFRLYVGAGRITSAASGHDHRRVPTALPPRRPHWRPPPRPSPPSCRPAARRRRPGANGERPPRPRQRGNHAERLRPLPRGK